MEIVKRVQYHIKALFGGLFSSIIRLFVKVDPNIVLCLSYNGLKYSCNPRYITEFLLHRKDSRYRIYWLFNEGVDVSEVPNEVTVIRRDSFKHFIIINKAKFIINNSRTAIRGLYWLKRREQRYIMTWHSSNGLKKIEADAGVLGKYYVRNAKRDSKLCDLILSGCRFRSEVIRRAFWYENEILERGTPRNDIFFKENSHLVDKVRVHFNLDANVKVVLYAPTFRSSYTLENYDIDWRETILALNKRFESEFVVLYRLHPNFIGRDYMEGMPSNVIDATLYHDMQELLIASDVLITDYSSSMFDYALLRKPCFLYMKDRATYDRGNYFEFDELPFPNATDSHTLKLIVDSFDMSQYLRDVDSFQSNVIHTFEKGNAAEAVLEWMDRN